MRPSVRIRIRNAVTLQRRRLAMLSADMDGTVGGFPAYRPLINGTAFHGGPHYLPVPGADHNDKVCFLTLRKQVETAPLQQRFFYRGSRARVGIGFIERLTRIG